MGQGQSHLQMKLGKHNCHMQKNELEPLSYDIYNSICFNQQM